MSFLKKQKTDMKKMWSYIREIICTLNLNANSLITMYYSFIYPYLTYAIELFGSFPTTRLTPILKL